MTASTKLAPDWERIEQLYRAGVLSVREIATENNVSHTAIQKRSKSHGWERDLGAKIKAKANALVAKSGVATQVATETAVSDRAIVEANAKVIADVRIAHRQDIARARSLAMSLLSEVETQTDYPDLLEQLEGVLRGDNDAQDAMLKVFNRVTSTSGRIDNIKKLSESLKVLVGMEREAYEVGTDPNNTGDQATTGLAVLDALKRKHDSQ